METKQMTVGTFVARLRELPPETGVRFMFGGCPDMEVDSYRGTYSEAALGWSRGDYGTPSVHASALANSIAAQVGTTMSGWKGGEYLIEEDTLLWCDNSGCYSRCAVVGVDDYGRILIEGGE